MAVSRFDLTKQVKGLLPVANGGTGDSTLAAHGVLVGNGASAVNVTGTGSSGQVLTSNGASADPTFQPATGGGAGSGFAWGGDGSDGPLDFDGTNTYSGIETHTGAAPNLVYTLARDVFATTLIVEAGKTLRTAQSRIFASTSVTVNGSLTNDGTAASGTTGGLDGTTGNVPAGAYMKLPLNSTGGRNGTTGGAGSTGAGAQASLPGSGITATSALATAQYNPGSWSSGKGGAVGGTLGGAAQAYGGLGGNTTTINQPRYPQQAINFYTIIQTPAIQQYMTTNTLGAGAGGGGGAGDGANAGANGGAGGGTGGSGGFLVVSAPTITVGASGIISANGGVGGNGANGSNAVASGTGRGGGGGGAGGPGGNGGAVFLIYHTLSNSGTISANAGGGGTHGNGGTGFGTGANGDNGQDGQNGAPGFVIQILT